MALVVGTNSYVNVADTDVYFADRLGIAAWTASNATVKAQALITATSYLDNLQWIGSTIGVSQALAFPRVAEYFDPRTGSVEYLSGVPDRIIKATMELALHYVANPDALDSVSSVKSLEVGSVKLTNILPTPRVPHAVTQLIKPLRVNSGNNWWRAN